MQDFCISQTSEAGHGQCESLGKRKGWLFAWLQNFVYLVINSSVRGKTNLCPDTGYQRKCECFRAKFHHFSTSPTNLLPTHAQQNTLSSIQSKRTYTWLSICPSCRRQKTGFGFQQHCSHIEHPHFISLFLLLQNVGGVFGSITSVTSTLWYLKSLVSPH